MSFQTRIEAQLAERKTQQLFRKRKAFEGVQSSNIRLKERSETLINFCSNDYLGLASHPKLIESMQLATKKYGIGSGASHLVIGYHEEHEKLEEELASFLGLEKAILFGSGYSANIGVLTALLEKKDAVFEDKLNHASLLDGGLYSGANFQRYLHNDISSLNKKLSASEANNKLVVSDAVFSMDGDCANIKALMESCQQHDAWLMLDDAHGFGVHGKEGRGTVSEQGLKQTKINIYMATFGKALGCGGAFVAGDKDLIEYLVQFCRHSIYTTAMPPAMAATVREALRVMREENSRREHLQKLISTFKKEVCDMGLPLLESSTAIQPFVLGSAESALQWSEQLKEQGILVSAIRPPTVPPGTARLRITFSANHSEQDLERLLSALKKLNTELGVERGTGSREQGAK
jgi:8-amino-7-oxononanoate synthase